MCIIVAAFLLACNSGNRPPTLADIQRERISSVTVSDTVTEIIENSTNSAINEDSTSSTEVDNLPRSPKSTDADSIPRNTEWADADGNPRYWAIDVYGRQHTLHYNNMDVNPLFNGNNAIEELSKYINANTNSSIKKIAEENNIKKTLICYAFKLDTNGFVYDAKIHSSNTHQVLGEEALRLLIAMSEQGEWTPGKHDGRVINTWFEMIMFDIGYRNQSK